MTTATIKIISVVFTLISLCSGNGAAAPFNIRFDVTKRFGRVAFDAKNGEAQTGIVRFLAASNRLLEILTDYEAIVQELSELRDADETR